MGAERLFDAMVTAFLALAVLVLLLGVFVDSGLVLLGVFVLVVVGSFHIVVKAAKIRTEYREP